MPDIQQEALKEAKKVARACGNPKSIILAGIGGSNLGALAIYKALRPKKQIYFAETLDSIRLDRILENLQHPAVLIIVSKSGTTTETIANAGVLLNKLKKQDKVVAITDEGSKLWDWAEKYEFFKLSVPKEVVGRFSVFTAVGLFPLLLVGIKAEKLLEGAKEADNELALTSAKAIYESWKAGKIIHDMFLFEPDLEWLGKWYRQLVGESLGKEGKGITPTVSIGTTDLHSVGQLYLGGPKDKFTTFISVKNHGKDFTVPKDHGIEELVSGISGKKFSVLMKAVLEGVKTAYKKQNLPFIEAELEDVSEKSLGKFMQEKMMEVVHLAKMMGVNPFDNPAVELYKEETRKLLHNL